MLEDGSMTAGDTTPAEIAGRWQTNVVLKRDIFSTVERGKFTVAGGPADAVLRRLDATPWWTRPLARHFLHREARALAATKSLEIAPELLFASDALLVRRFIDGVPLHIARPIDDRAFFHSAHEALRRLHRASITHNDLAKQQNWLRAPNGRAYLTDFQLATRFKRRGKLFRIAAYEDLRHMLKHKRNYAPEALTAAERRILARKSWFTRMWMATGKKLYLGITRGVFRFVDREGAGMRLVDDGPTIAAMFKSIPEVRDVAVVAFPDRRAGTGLYAFIEAGNAAIKERNLREFITAAVGRQKAPERIQVVDALPRAATGEVRKEILELVAMNQVDLIAPLISPDDDAAVIDRIVAGRHNLRDRRF